VKKHKKYDEATVGDLIKILQKLQKMPQSKRFKIITGPYEKKLTTAKRLNADDECYVNLIDRVIEFKDYVAIERIV